MTYISHFYHSLQNFKYAYEIYTAIAYSHLSYTSGADQDVHYLIGTDMEALNDSHIIQLTNVSQVLQIVVVIVIVYAKLPLFTESICFTLQHQQYT